MKIHCCLLDKECRRWGALPRLFILTNNRQYRIALSKGASFVQPDGSVRYIETTKHGDR